MYSSLVDVRLLERGMNMGVCVYLVWLARDRTRPTNTTHSQTHAPGVMLAALE